VEGEVWEQSVNVMQTLVGSGEDKCEEVVEGAEVLFFFFGSSSASWMLE
jgi:hypothetical protein